MGDCKTTTEWAVWVWLLLSADRNGLAWPSRESTAAVTRQSVRSVHRAIRALERRGVLLRLPPANRPDYVAHVRSAVWEVRPDYRLEERRFQQRQRQLFG